MTHSTATAGSPPGAFEFPSRAPNHPLEAELHQAELLETGLIPFSFTRKRSFSSQHESAIHRQHTALCARVDRTFAWLMLVQWIAAIVIAAAPFIRLHPFTWTASASSLPPHVTLALLYGGILTLVPVALTRIAPGARSTRLTIAVAQMLMSSLLIQLTGGRIETHFHIFGSLALLAYYLDWQVLLTASLVVAFDHLLRGIFMPSSVFGVGAAQPWRWIEHTGWLLFCDLFLITAAVGRLRDMRNYIAHNEERGKLLHRAYHDQQTGLPNRSFLDEKLIEMIAKARDTGASLSCVYIDLDRFKEVNDQFGHTQGDELFIQVANRLRERLSDDMFLARARSDEFVALIPELKPPDPSPIHASTPQPKSPPASIPRRAEAFTRAILRSMHAPFDIAAAQVIVGASIGISRYPEHIRDTNEDQAQAGAELLLHSDKAMYHVKRSGRNDYLVYAPELFAESAHRAEAEGRLRSAIANREFKVFYQPIVRPSGEVCNLEALMRWINPRPGKPNIPPSQFIPLAEQSGLIVQLGSFVLHEACRQATDWRSRGLLPGRIAVNVSSIELSREDYAETTILTLRQHYTPPDAIELEVTESALVHDFTLAERHLRDLRKFGISVSIDDFGTGYSSLGRLRQLTLDTLKIDRLFIEGVAGSEADRTVVEHIVSMAHTLQMTVIAEGVETEEQLEVMRDLGCDLIQGYLFAKPQGSEQTEALLIHHRAALIS